MRCNKKMYSSSELFRFLSISYRVFISVSRLTNRSLLSNPLIIQFYDLLMVADNNSPLLNFFLAWHAFVSSVRSSLPCWGMYRKHKQQLANRENIMFFSDSFSLILKGKQIYMASKRISYAVEIFNLIRSSCLQFS